MRKIVIKRFGMSSGIENVDENNKNKDWLTVITEHDVEAKVGMNSFQFLQQPHRNIWKLCMRILVNIPNPQNSRQSFGRLYSVKIVHFI